MSMHNFRTPLVRPPHLSLYLLSQRYLELASDTLAELGYQICMGYSVVLQHNQYPPDEVPR